MRASTTVAERRRWAFIGIRWPLIDEGVSIDAIMTGSRSTEMLRHCVAGRRRGTRRRALSGQLQFVQDGDVLLDDFEVVATPGHTPGHVSYFYRPERALFAGDALAVIDGRIRFMARPVTLDPSQARSSLAKVLDLRPQIVCPGHREPLAGAESACEAMRDYLGRGGKWPLLG